uniref:Intrinsic disordered protein n=1 Tax=Rocahepevirus sp. TaxID=2961098 RepID=A0AAF0Z1V3_9VIRU|nr:intrinsic disordered protein [Rocahepevirus sp.]
MSPPRGLILLGRPRLLRQRLPPLLMLRWYAPTCRILKPPCLLSFSPLCSLSLSPLFLGRIRYSVLFIIFWRRTSAARLALAWRSVRTLDLLMSTPMSFTDAFSRLTVEICNVGETARGGAQLITSAVAFLQGARLLIFPFVQMDSNVAAIMPMWGSRCTPSMIYIRARSPGLCVLMACTLYML